jgi:hypothetical protein
MNLSSAYDEDTDPVPLCALSWRSIYTPCRCDNRCVIFVAVILPLLTLLMFTLCRCKMLVHSELEHAHDGSSACREQQALAGIQGLPSMVWGGASPVDECSLCMEPIVHGQVVRRLPCAHDYHLVCIDRWLHRSRNCPLCRRNPLIAPASLTLRASPTRRRESHGAARPLIGPSHRRSNSSPAASPGQRVKQRALER